MAPKRYVALLGVVIVSATSAVLLIRRRSAQRERREFAERYAKQIQAARQATSVYRKGADSSRRLSEISDADMKNSPATVNVVYGSESGNAEGLARGFVMTLRDRGVPASLIDPSRWNYFTEYLQDNKRGVPLFHPVNGESSCANATKKHRDRTGVGPSPSSPLLVYIFIVATAGEGEPASNFTTLFHEMQSTVRQTTAPLVHSQPGGDTVEAPFKGIYYAVFGLGDSSYKYYCRCATDTNTLLKRGGGISLHRVGFGDARSGMQEDVFDEWQEKVMLSLEEKCGLEMTAGTRVPPKPELVFRFLPFIGETPAAAAATTPTTSPLGSSDRTDGTATPVVQVISDDAGSRGKAPPQTTAPSDSAAKRSTSSSSNLLPYSPPPGILEPSLTNPTRIRLVRKTQLTPSRESDGSSVYRFCFETDRTGISYQAGDHLSIFPANPPDIVARCAKALSITADLLATPVELCEVEPSRGISRNVLPSRVPLCVVLERYVDLSGRPKKSTLRVLAKYCTDPLQQDAFFDLLRISPEKDADGKEAADKLTSQKAKKMRSVVDYLESFPSCCSISIGHFIEVMPRTQPRYYSIASDRMSHGTHIEIFVRVLVDGLAGNYLAYRVGEGDEVYGYVRRSIFHLPQRIGDKRPVLMIGPGTGAAALVGFCYKKEALVRSHPEIQYGPTVFFFGAQHRSSEYFVEEELHRWAMEPAEMQQWDADHRNAHAGVVARRYQGYPSGALPTSIITKLDCAFSRDQEEKVYVTSLIQKHKDLIYEMLTSATGGGCLVYLSGDASFMAKEVDRALMMLLQQCGNMTRIEALEFLRRMEREHRYLKDVY